MKRAVPLLIAANTVYVIAAFFLIKIDREGTFLSTALFVACFACFAVAAAYQISFYKAMKRAYPEMRFRSVFQAKRFLAGAEQEGLLQKAKTAVDLFVCVLVLVLEVPFFLLVGMLLRA